jgi:hypothetical protein
MKKILIVALFVLALLPAWASAGMVEGTVQGFTCVTQGKICPVGREDPMAAAERVFVVLTTGKSYYFVPNVDRAVLARHINDRVRVSGTVASNYPSIEANKIEVFSKGAWKQVWSFSWQKEIDKQLQSASE